MRKEENFKSISRDGSVKKKKMTEKENKEELKKEFQYIEKREKEIEKR